MLVEVQGARHKGAMTAQLEISTEGPLGIIALNRPEAINALSGEMIQGVTETLAAWRDDPAIQLVLFEARGARGFCSGGDVRAARQQVLDGHAEAADAYFAAEYAMNGLIATYPKPTVVIGHGAVMGGGIGIFSHCRYRFALPESRFAMPEAAIGFVSDIGVNAILAQVSEWRALAFLMAGLPVGTADALALGLCDAAIDPGRVDVVRSGVRGAAQAVDPETALVLLMQAESIERGPPAFCDEADRLAAAFSGASAAEIVTAIEARAAGDQDAMALAEALAGRSPTSLEAVLQSHRAARRRPEIAAVLALDLRLAKFLCRRLDFAEGVRAVLVDKDRAPRWHPGSLAEVDRAAIAAVVDGRA
jgi:enoyl-CoA hydratase/carnithine racemase